MRAEAAWRMPLATGLAMAGLLVLAAAAAPWLAAHPPDAIDFLALQQPPSAVHPLGTDQYGRDVLSRILHGARLVLLVAPAATALGLALGSLLGLAAAYAGGWRDEALMRALDGAMALPTVILAMLVLTALGPSTVNVVLVIGLAFAPLVARSVRAAALAEARKEYVLAAQMRGESTAYILVFEILPNIYPVLLVEASLRLGYAIFTAATLGFLGLGAQPPTPDWGLMVSESQALLTVAPWLVLAPVAAIAYAVIAVALIADGVQALLDR